MYDDRTRPPVQEVQSFCEIMCFEVVLQVPACQTTSSAMLCEMNLCYSAEFFIIAMMWSLWTWQLWLITLNPEVLGV